MDHLRCRMSSKLIVEYETFSLRSLFLLNSKFKYERMFQHLPHAIHCCIHHIGHDGHRWSDSVFFRKKLNEQTEILSNNISQWNISELWPAMETAASKQESSRKNDAWIKVHCVTKRERERERAAFRLSLKLYAAAVTKVRQWSAGCTFIWANEKKISNGENDRGVIFPTICISVYICSEVVFQCAINYRCAALCGSDAWCDSKRMKVRWQKK